MDKIRLQLLAAIDIAYIMAINFAEWDGPFQRVATGIGIIVGIATFVRLVWKFRSDRVELEIKHHDLAIKREEMRVFFQKQNYMKAQRVIELAKTYVGNKEQYANKFIDDPKVYKDLGELIKKAGQNDGEAWCTYFAEAMFVEAYPEMKDMLRKNFSASAVATHKQFVKAGFQSHMTPKPGDLVIWQKYVIVDSKSTPHWSGHAGIVSEVYANGTFKTIEGNTNNDGSREGDGVYEKLRNIGRVAKGLNILGFITLV